MNELQQLYIHGFVNGLLFGVLPMIAYWSWKGIKNGKK